MMHPDHAARLAEDGASNIADADGQTPIRLSISGKVQVVPGAGWWLFIPGALVIVAIAALAVIAVLGAVS